MNAQENKIPGLNVKIVLLSVLAITIIGSIAYCNSLQGQFIWDDDYLIVANRYIKDLSHLKNILAENIGAGAERIFMPYRPVQIYSYAADNFFWGSDVTGYHITNLILHILAGLSLYWLLNVIFKNNILSLISAAFYVSHPIHTEAVSYISGRADPLAAFFMLICFIYYIKYLETEKLSYYIFMAAAFLVALFSRENSLIMPVIMILYHYTFKKKLTLKAFVPILSGVLLFAFMRHQALKSFDFQSHAPGTLFDRIPGFFVALTSYLRLLILPLGLHIGYPDKLFSPMDPLAITGFLIFVLLLFLIFRLRSRDDIAFFSLAWFLITLLPQSNLYPMSAYMSEHWLYIPSIGYFILLSHYILRLSTIKNLRLFATSIAVMLLASYCYLTFKQNRYWSKPVYFYETTLKFCPENPKLYANLGKLYVDMGDNRKAIDLYKKALEINPGLARIYYNLSIAYYYEGEYDLAIENCDIAIKMGHKVRPDFLKLIEPYRVKNVE